MKENSVVESLYLKGMSYRTLAIVTGIHIKDVKEARHEPSILSLESRRRCQQIDEILTEALAWEDSFLDPVAVFEEEIMIGKVDNKIMWAKLCELWVNGRIDDNRLKDMMRHTATLYSYEELRMNHPMEYEVVDGGDGFKSILAKLPISRAEGDQLRRFEP